MVGRSTPTLGGHQSLQVNDVNMENALILFFREMTIREGLMEGEETALRIDDIAETDELLSSPHKPPTAPLPQRSKKRKSTSPSQ